MIIKCSECSIAIQSTKGSTPEEKLESLFENFQGHLKRKHQPEYEEIMASIARCAGIATQLILTDYVELHKTQSGRDTEEAIDTSNELLADEICNILSIDQAEDEEDEEQEEDEENTVEATIVGEDGEEVETGEVLEAEIVEVEAKKPLQPVE